MKKPNPFYKTAAWKRCRLGVLERDNYICQQCLLAGRLTVANTVHHIKALEEHPELALDPENLESVCPPCHNKEHPEKGRRKMEEPKKTRRVVVIKTEASIERW